MFNSKQIFLMLSAMLVSGVTFAATSQTTMATTSTTSSSTTNSATGKTSASTTTNATINTTNNATNKRTNGITAAPIAIGKQGMTNNTVGGVPVRPADAVITDKVKEELLASKNINSLSISVATDKGVVTLNGTVGNELQKEEVVKITSQIAGVKSVIDQMVIGDT